MSFYVDTDELYGLVELLDRVSDQALAGRTYVLTNTGLAGGEGWLNQLSGAHTGVVNQTTNWLGTLSDPVAAKSSGAVDRTINEYRATDDAAAARLDATIDSYGSQPDLPNPGSDYWARISRPEQPVSELVETGPPSPPLPMRPRGAFDDVRDPADALRPIHDYDTDPAFSYEPSWSESVSASSMGRNAIYTATWAMAKVGWLDRAYDPYEFILKPVVGDWAGFRGCADVFRNLADAMMAKADNLYHARVGLSGAWRGNAAGACHVHLQRMNDALIVATDPLRRIADEYERAAQGQADFRSTIETLLSDLIDAAIAFCIAAGVGGATSETVVGGLLGGAVAAYEAWKILNILNSVNDVLGRVQTVMDSVDASMNKFGQLQAADYVLPELPQVSGDQSALSALPT